ncbi:MAG: hypothetical protein Q8N35_15280 [Methylococcaceae bacterium]|nr:hypothetical protein [Methylococcaceae bacterium]MDP2392037.1 hypothetical protein [Methylococcaceae bacterium]MDP3020941.1 hypothetical protein [Methylococcaceae bacterium]MDP3391154.1 hypothetical protein [Methylococcaceae bacterium]MDP3931697.1 hypothetical protein [Methylococcaceae bacterium]
MSTIDKDRLYKLLPYIYQLRDHEQGEPLRELLQVISEQLELVEADMAQLYENWFIETCEDWVVPYLGDLIGYTPVHEAGEPGEVSSLQGQLRNKNLIPRREVANTIRYRRRKGSLALLEQLANDVAGWPARAVEFYTLLSATQALNHRQCYRGLTVDLRRGDALDMLDGPFDELAHTVDVRRVNSYQTQGRYNIPSVGVFVWRLKTYSVTQTPVTALEQRHCYVFSVLGNNTPLFTNWQREIEPTQIAGELNLPVPIRRRAFVDASVHKDVSRQQASADYYGEAKSLQIWATDWPAKDTIQPIPREKIVPADLSDWESYRPVKDTVAVDPVLGRILFPPKQPPRKGVRVSYFYGFSADIGGGEYARRLAQPLDYVIYQVSSEQKFTTINQALVQWKLDQALNAVIEIADSGLYEERLNIELKTGQTLQIRAANKKRPVIRLSDRPDQFSVSGGDGSYLTLDGLLISGRGLQIEGDIAGVIIRHSTLVPGWSLEPDCEPSQLEEPSIDITNAHPCVTIEHSIIGSIQVNIDEVKLDPLRIRISDSILDATGSDCEGPACEAIGAAGSSIAHAVLTIKRSTVFGRIDTHAIELAENSIFMGTIRVARRQLGCMRFCYVRPVSRTPKRYHCQPDLVEQLAENSLIQTAEKAGQPKPDKTVIDAAKRLEQERVRPQFNSFRYGTPSYCQLAENCADEINRGADDESELGVFHDLFQPQREANLQVRLDEYIPARADVGIIVSS